MHPEIYNGDASRKFRASVLYELNGRLVVWVDHNWPKGGFTVQLRERGEIYSDRLNKIRSSHFEILNKKMGNKAQDLLHVVLRYTRVFVFGVFSFSF